MTWGGTGAILAVKTMRDPRPTPWGRRLAGRCLRLVALLLVAGLLLSGLALAVLHGDQDRVVVPLSAMPTTVRDAVLAAEDARFYQHGALDLRGIAGGRRRPDQRPAPRGRQQHRPPVRQERRNLVLDRMRD